MKQWLSTVGFSSLALIFIPFILIVVLLGLFLINAVISIPIIYLFGLESPPIYEFVQNSSQAGFFKGLLHGSMVLISFIASLFSDSISLYELDNNGMGYNIGYALGLFILYCFRSFT